MKIKGTIFIYFMAVLLIFLLISFISVSGTQNSFFHFSTINTLTDSDIISESLLLLMSTELPQLEEDLNKNDIETPDFSSLLFEFTSGITPQNFTSLLELELPGMKSFSSGAYLAGEKSDITAMPIESPPPDFEKLLEEEKENSDEPEEKDETGQDKTDADVLIYHSHAWEAFLPLMDDSERKPSEASTTNNNQNIAYAGSMLTEQLEQRGINTFHDKTNVTARLHERGWGYSDSYQFSRQTIEEAMSINDNLTYFIDVHRDAQRKEETTITIDGEDYARIFFIVGLGHEDNERNLAFAEELDSLIESKYPGLSKGIYEKGESEGNGIYNQDISGQSILIEFGGVDNTREELKNTAEVLAEAIRDHQKGDAVKVNNTN